MLHHVAQQPPLSPIAGPTGGGCQSFQPQAVPAVDALPVLSPQHRRAPAGQRTHAPRARSTVVGRHRPHHVSRACRVPKTRGPRQRRGGCDPRTPPTDAIFRGQALQALCRHRRQYARRRGSRWKLQAAGIGNGHLWEVDMSEPDHSGDSSKSRRQPTHRTPFDPSEHGCLLTAEPARLNRQAHHPTALSVAQHRSLASEQGRVPVRCQWVEARPRDVDC